MMHGPINIRFKNYLFVVYCLIFKKKTLLFPFLYITICLSGKHPTFLMSGISLLFGCFVFPPRCDRSFQSVTASFAQYESFYALGSATRAGQMDGPVGQLPRMLRCHWSNRKYGAGTHRFSIHARTFPKITCNLPTGPQSSSPALCYAEGVRRMSV